MPGGLNVTLAAEIAGTYLLSRSWPHRKCVSYQGTSDLGPTVFPVLSPPLCHPLTVSSANLSSCHDDVPATGGWYQLCNCSPVVLSAPCVALKAPVKMQ